MGGFRRPELNALFDRAMIACGASSMASHATATKLIPSPRYETAKPRISRRNTRLESTGR